MGATRYYDAARKQLIYVDTPATSEFWDANWEGQRLAREVLLNAAPTQWSCITEEFLKPEDGPILEGGCGPGVHVAAMQSAGFEAIGVDFAERTVKTLQKDVPELDIRLGDVRNLDFEDNTFAGYWSLGVIEHFWGGYDQIASEAYRVLKPEGILFMVFPFLNPVRAWKGRLRFLPRWDGQVPSRFYQFALNSADVSQYFQALGFELVERRNVLGRQGFAEEFPQFWNRLKGLLDSKSTSLSLRIRRRILYEIATRIMRFTCYSDLLVLRKPK